MTLNQIKNLLLSCPPSRCDGGDPRLKKALRAAQKSPELQALLDAQVKFDGHIADRLHAIPLPVSLSADATKIESSLSHQTAPSISFRDPAIISVIVAAILLMGLGIWLVFGKMSSFPGTSDTWRVVLEGNTTPWDRLEPLKLKMDVLNDWFAMKGMDQFWAPSTFGKLDIIGGGVFNVSDIPVAMGVIDHPRMFFYAFNGTRLGILPPADGRWKILTHERKTIGVTRQGDSVFVIEIDGTQRELQQILHHSLAH